ncbi:MAG: fatty acid desaturase [Pseudomonadota bacterium]
MNQQVTHDSEVPSELRAHITAEKLKPPSEMLSRSVPLIVWNVAIPFFFIAVMVVIARIESVHPVVVLGLAFPLALASQRCFQTLVHDIAHKLISLDLARNDLLGNYLAAGWIGASIQAYRAVHTQHHRYNGSTRDPEHISYAEVRDNGGLLRHNLRYILGLEATRLVKKYYGRKEKLEPDEATVAKQVRATKLHLFVCQAALALLFIFAADAWYLYCLWLYLAVTWNPLLSRLRFLVEHPGESDLTVSTDASFLERLYFAPYNFNYHLEHHLWPSVPPYRLSNAHRYLVEQQYFERHPEFRGDGFIKSLSGRG